MSSSVAFSSQIKKKIKVLCLHGYQQNAEVFGAKTGSLRKGLKSLCDLTYVDGPHLALVQLLGNDVTANERPENQRSWWNWVNSGETVTERPSRASTYLGIEESVNALKKVLQDCRPDIILGFSQGATITAILLATLCKEYSQQEVEVLDDSTRRRKPKIKYLLPDGKHYGEIQCGILVGGFLPLDDNILALLREFNPSLPSLFVAGKSDELVPVEKSIALMNCFDKEYTQLHLHDGGHFVPTCTKDFKQVLIDFITNNSS